MIYTVYKHTFPNGKVYIGMTSRRIEYIRPMNYHCSSKMFNAILKFGWDNVSHSVISTHTNKEDAYKAEYQAIKENNSAYDGYNACIAGNKGRASYFNKHICDMYHEFWKLREFQRSEQLEKEVERVYSYRFSSGLSDYYNRIDEDIIESTDDDEIDVVSYWECLTIPLYKNERLSL